MATVPRMIESVVDYTVDELEALERERPELGRVEVIDGALHATGDSAVGAWHQMVLSRLCRLMGALCPPGSVVLPDTWWFGPRGKLRADIGVYAEAALPPTIREKVLRVAPLAIVEVLSDDAHHDLVRKDGVYAGAGARRAFLDFYPRTAWWCRLDGQVVTAPRATWQLDGWPPIELHRDALFARVPLDRP